MMNPLKLALMIFGCASFLAVTPYAVRKALRPSPIAATEQKTQVFNLDTEIAAKVSRSAPELLTAKPVAPAVAKPVAMTDEKLPSPIPKEQMSVLNPLPQPKSGSLPEQPLIVASLPSPAAAKITASPSPTATPKPEIPYRPEVAKTQESLSKLGFEIGKVDGKLGQKTQAAIAEFQKRNSLKTTADADAETVLQLEKAVAQLPPPAPAAVVVAQPKNAGPVPGLNSMADVKRIQQALAAVSFYSETPDGKWGEKTIAAMREFQGKHELQVTGKPDKKTWLKLAAVASSPELAAAKTAVAAVAKIEEKQVAVAPAPQAAPAKAEAPAVVGNEETKLDARLIAAAPATTPAQTAPAIQDKPAPMLSGIASGGEISAVASGMSEQVQAALSATPETEAPVIVASAESRAPAPQKFPQKSEISQEPAKVAPAAQPASSVSGQPVENSETFEISQPAPQVPSVPAAAPLAASAPAAQVPSLSGPGKEVVIRMNADAGAVEGGSISAPARVSTAIKTETKPAQKPEETPAAAVTQITTAKAEALMLPPVKAASTRNTEQLEREMTKAQVDATKSNDGLVMKEPTKVVDSLNTLVAKVERDVKKDPSQSEGVNLEEVKKETSKKKAQEKFDEIAELYKLVKNRFADQVKKGALAERMAKIDTGFNAMKKDFKAGNYSPIVDRGDGFKLAIEMLADEAASKYLETKLETKTVRGKLKKTELKEIQDLREQKKFVEAVDLMEASLKEQPKARKRS